MSSKWILLLVLLCLFHEAISGPKKPTKTSNFDEIQGDESTPEPTEELIEEETTTENSTDDETRSSIDTNVYYRLFNGRFGPTFALDISRVGEYFVPKMTPLDRTRNGQLWRFVAVEGDVYLIQNFHAGNKSSLEFVKDRSEKKLILSKTSDAPGQFWILAPTQNSRYRIHNEFLGDQQFLTVYSRTRYAYMNATGLNEHGHLWSLEPIAEADEQ